MNKVAKNYLYNLSFQILIIIVPLFTTPYVSRVLGAKGVGLFSYTNSIVQYFILFGAIGLNLYGQREIAYNQHDVRSRDKVFWELIILRVCTISISLIVYFLTLATRGEYASIYMIMSLEILASMFDISWFFQGIEDFKKIVLRNIIVKLSGVVLIFLFINSYEDILLFIMCHSATLLVSNIMMWLYIPNCISKVSVADLEISRHIKPTIILFFPQIATSVYTVLDKTMLGLITGVVDEVAFYEQGQKVVKIVLTIVTSLGTVIMPRVANLYKKNETIEIENYLKKSFQFGLFLSFPMMFGIMALSSNIVPWFFGPGYEKVIPNIMIISPVLVIIALSNIIGTQYMLPTGRQKEFSISIVTGCVCNFFLNMLLIPNFYSYGAAIATVIAELCVTVVQMYYTKKEFNFIEIYSVNRRYLYSSLVMFCPVLLIAKYLHPSIFNTFICILTGLSIYIMCLYFRRDKMIVKIIDTTKEKLFSLINK